MISQLAIDDLDAMIADGLNPTPADVVRLNAMGLRLEAAKKKHPLDATEYLPRAARLGKAVFRQPTIGHEIWMDRVLQLVSMDSFESVLAVKVYALTRDPCDLPNPDRDDIVKTAVQAFADTFIEYTRDQIAAVVDYVENGADETDGERPPAREITDEELKFTDEQAASADWKYSAALGILHEGQAVLFGLPRKELEAMTRRQVNDLMRRAYAFHDFTCSPDLNRLQGDYFATRVEIRTRLEEEKKNG